MWKSNLETSGGASTCNNDATLGTRDQVPSQYHLIPRGSRRRSRMCPADPPTRSYFPVTQPPPMRPLLQTLSFPWNLRSSHQPPRLHEVVVTLHRVLRRRWRRAGSRPSPDRTLAGSGHFRSLGDLPTLSFTAQSDAKFSVGCTSALGVIDSRIDGGVLAARVTPFLAPWGRPCGSFRYEIRAGGRSHVHCAVALTRKALHVVLSCRPRRIGQRSRSHHQRRQ